MKAIYILICLTLSSCAIQKKLEKAKDNECIISAQNDYNLYLKKVKTRCAYGVADGFRNLKGDLYLWCLNYPNRNKDALFEKYFKQNAINSYENEPRDSSFCIKNQQAYADNLEKELTKIRQKQEKERLIAKQKEDRENAQWEAKWDRIENQCVQACEKHYTNQYFDNCVKNCMKNELTWSDVGKMFNIK